MLVPDTTSTILIAVGALAAYTGARAGARREYSRSTTLPPSAVDLIWRLRPLRRWYLMRRLHLVLAGAALLTAAASAGCASSPAAPTPSAETHVFGADIAAACGRFPNTVTTVTVSVDGRTIGTTTPGGPAVTTMVALGSHAVSGRAQNGVVWSDNRTLTPSQPDFIVTFACF